MCRTLVSFTQEYGDKEKKVVFEESEYIVCLQHIIKLELLT